LLRALAGQTGVADHGVAVDADQPANFPHASAICEVSQQGVNFVFGKLRGEQERPFMLGETCSTRAANQHTMLFLFAIPAIDDQVTDPTLAVIGTLLVLAAEVGKIA
jgi:hypothetical protein